MDNNDGLKLSMKRASGERDENTQGSCKVLYVQYAHFLYIYRDRVNTPASPSMGHVCNASSYSGVSFWKRTPKALTQSS